MLPDLIACTVSLWIKPKTNLSSLIFIVSCRGAILDKLIEMIKKKTVQRINVWPRWRPNHAVVLCSIRGTPTAPGVNNWEQ